MPMAPDVCNGAYFVIGDDLWDEAAVCTFILRPRFPFSHLETRLFMLKFLPVLILLFLLAAMPALAADVPGKISLSRDAAVLMAVRNNIDLRVQALNSSIAKTGLARSRSLYDPQLNTSANYGDVSYPGESFGTTSAVTSVEIARYLPTGGRLSANTQTGYTSADHPASGLPPKDWLSSVGVTLSQPLLKNAGRETTELSISLADTNYLDSLESFRFFITDKVFSVITGYNRLYVLRQILKSREDALASAQHLRRQLNEKSRTGKLQAMDIANTDYAISQRRKDLIDAGKNVSDQEATLRYLLGMETKQEIVPVDPPSREEPPESEIQARQLALEHRADLKQLRQDLQSQQLQERVSRHQQLPDLSMTASAGFSGVGSIIGDSYDQIGNGGGGYWSAGLYLSVPLGNTAAENDYRQSRIRTEQLKQRIKAYEWQIRDAVEADMRSLISARLQLHSTDQSLHYAEQRLAEYRKQLLDGTNSVQDFLNAENDQIAARNSQLQAVESFAYAVTLLWRNVGVLLDHQHVRIDTSDPAKLTEGGQPAPPTHDDTAVVAAASKLAKSSPAAVRGKSSGSQPASQATPAPPKAPAPVSVPKPVKGAPAAGAYNLKVGAFVTGAQVSAASEKIRAAGLKARVEAGPKVLEPMIRLQYGRYPDQEQARQALTRLRKAYADGFILGSKQDGYSVYAGSYFNARGAQQEQRRLSALGVQVTLAETRVPVPTRLLTAGHFADRARAQKALERLQSQGLQPELLPLKR